MQLELRPPVQALVFQVYGRRLHPELFQILASRVVQGNDYRLTVRITSTGHWITWERGGLLVSEVAAAPECGFPGQGKLLDYRLRQGHSGKVDLGGGYHYEMCFHVETLEPADFLRVHEEILHDGQRKGLIHQFQAHNRFSLSPVGFVTADGRPGCVITAAFHTFPAEFTVVKTQSLIEKR